MTDAKSIERVALIGFGEAGGILGAELAKAGIQVTMFDILLRSEPARGAMLDKARSAGVRACESLADAVREANLMISAVTCSAALEVAKESARALRAGQIHLDINSVSPDAKREMSECVERSGADFVEAAVMAPVPPQRLRVPMLLGGKRAAELAPRLAALGMNAKAVSERIGVASAIKMCRSVIVKGLEALVVESMFTARHYGAEDAVLASLAASYPGMGWTERLPDHVISRVAEHGERRAAEMREAGETVADAGIEPLMALAAAERQEWLVREMAERGIRYDHGKPFSWRELADALAKVGAA
jgi:3-hydroxyisobutyrate dehydrogenase-like beta-hydroxyacid dehydrogenase